MDLLLQFAWHRCIIQQSFCAWARDMASPDHSDESENFRKAKADLLWDKISSFEFDTPEAIIPFSSRLARDHFWSEEYTHRVLNEYLRFVYLAVITTETLTPSNDVDEAWHLHLSYTRSYWDDLCKNILGRPLHHDPTEGGPEASKFYQERYARTLERYLLVFEQDPPADIWPDVATRFSPERGYRTVSLDRYWMVRRLFGTTAGKAVWAALFVSVLAALFFVGQLLSPKNGLVSFLLVGGGMFAMNKATTFLFFGAVPFVITAEFALTGESSGDGGDGCGGCGGCGG
jgi:hypothetical protein